jgi:hypothetical protein
MRTEKRNPAEGGRRRVVNPKINNLQPWGNIMLG